MTKHQDIIDYIKKLAIGKKISVRGVSRRLKVSDGTAYRAIKAAENEGLVSTIPQVGTIRVNKKKPKEIDEMTFQEVVEIVKGTVLGGASGLKREFSRFLIAAMEAHSVQEYLLPNSLLIVGNRFDIQQLAIKNKAAVLITGGFSVDEEIIHLADELAIPIIQTEFDTFTVASIINQAINDQLIKKELVIVEDIYRPIEKTNYLKGTQSVKDFNELAKKTGENSFPVVNQHFMVIGIISQRDLKGKNKEDVIDKFMTKSPIVARKSMSVASVSHRMTFEDLKMMPVVNRDYTLAGTIERQDVVAAMRTNSNATQAADKLSDQILNTIVEKEGFYQVKVTPKMINSFGDLSLGTVTEILSDIATRTMRKKNVRNVLIDQINFYRLHAAQLEQILEIYPKVVDTGRRTAVVDFEVYHLYQVISKAVVTLQIVEK
ncbi:MAG: CBS domain-containing protein [Streptococcaceae bacterium]|jgi:predicted transcriptional regulator|nr:CBS domain-containing protein [Streptococcaceae bacterium]